MKKFLIKSVWFLSPFLLLLATTHFYTKDKGDLLRVGFLKADNSYREAFKTEMNQPIFYDLLSHLNTKKKSSYTVLIIGDSFSAQGCYGYPNYLAQSDSIRVMYCDFNKYGNSIETLYGVLNDGILDRMDIRYVLLESVERDFVKRGYELNKQIKLSDFPRPTNHGGKINYNTSFPPPEIVKFPLYSVLYYFSDDAFFSDVYQVKLDRPLFTGSRTSTLLFHKLELKNIGKNNTIEAVSNLNTELNKVAEKLHDSAIKLIVLPCPDKYVMYYKYITNKVDYPKPLFFDIMKQMNKSYIYIDSKSLLGHSIQTKKDLYFFDDTHWSPWASQVIAKQISTMIKQNK